MKVEVLHDIAVTPNLAQKNTNQACAYAMIDRLKDGQVFCAYRCGTTKHSYDGKLVGQRSGDMGKTWVEPIVIYDGAEFSPPRPMVSFQAFVAGDGSLLVVMSTIEVTEPGSYLFSDEGRSQPRQCYKMHSYDGGKTWTDPEPIYFAKEGTPGIVGKSFVLANGEIFFNFHFRQALGPCTMSGCFSSDNGKTISSPTDMVWDPNGKLNYDDPYYTVFPDGQAVGLYWTHQQDTEETVDVHRCVSDDNGRSWSKPESVGMLGQISVPLALDEKTMLVASNFRQQPDGVRLWISHDRGVSFDESPIQMWDAESESLLVQPVQSDARAVENEGVWEALARFTFGTPGLLDLDDGTILLSYYATVDDVIHIRTCRFKLL